MLMQFDNGEPDDRISFRELIPPLLAGLVILDIWLASVLTIASRLS